MWSFVVMHDATWQALGSIASVTDVNDESRDVRIEYPVVTRGVRRFILDASQYRPPKGLFRRE